jgi:hypothetical protein
LIDVAIYLCNYHKQISNAILKAFANNSNSTTAAKLLQEQPQAFRSYVTLNDPCFLFCCSILQYSGILIFKPILKWIESNDGLNGCDMYYQMLQWEQQIQTILQNYEFEFRFCLKLDCQFSDKQKHDLIVQHIQSALQSLSTRFDFWKHIPYKWMALNCKNQEFAKKIALELSQDLMTPVDFHWQYLTEFVSQNKLQILKELKKFATQFSFFDQFPLLNGFHLIHFSSLCIHNVDVERIFALLSHVTGYARNAKLPHLSATIRNHVNKTKLSHSYFRQHWPLTNLRSISSHTSNDCEYWIQKHPILPVIKDEGSLNLYFNNLSIDKTRWLHDFYAHHLEFNDDGDSILDRDFLEKHEESASEMEEDCAVLEFIEPITSSTILKRLTPINKKRKSQQTDFFSM